MKTMTYPEYQVWFHAFNSAYAALVRRENISPYQAERDAESAATRCLGKFKEVKMPETPDIKDLDLQGMVNKVMQNATGKP